MNNEKHGQGPHCTKMGADSLAENIPNLSAQFVCPSPKVLNLNEKRLHWASIVREISELSFNMPPKVILWMEMFKKRIIGIKFSCIRLTLILFWNATMTRIFWTKFGNCNHSAAAFLRDISRKALELTTATS